MIPLDKVLAWMVLAVGGLAVLFGVLALRDVHILTQTNATLVDLLDTQLNVTQARMSRLEEIQAGGIEALLGDGAAAYVEVLRRETDK